VKEREMNRHLLAILFALGFVLGCEPQTPAEQAKSERNAAEFDEELDVSKLAEDSIKQCLKWPRDASFNWCPSINFNADRSASMVKGTVVAKNDFGASLTHEYAVIMVKEIGTWQVDMVTIGGKMVYRRKIEAAPVEQTKPKQHKRQLPAVEPAKSVSRTWTDKAGNHTTEATFAGAIGNKIKLRKVDGKVITVLLENLSDEDQKWIKDKQKRG
jgi:hypothetical protein